MKRRRLLWVTAGCLAFAFLFLAGWTVLTRMVLSTRARIEWEHGVTLPPSARGFKCEGDAWKPFGERWAVSSFEMDDAEKDLFTWPRSRKPETFRTANGLELRLPVTTSGAFGKAKSQCAAFFCEVKLRGWDGECFGYRGVSSDGELFFVIGSDLRGPTTLVLVYTEWR